MPLATAPAVDQRLLQTVRVTYTSTSSFDDVLARLRQRIGKVAHLGTVVASPVSLAEYEERAHASLGSSGFLTIHEIDFTPWLNKYGIARRAFRWIVGNPLIAIDLMRHDKAAGLVLPAELIVTDSEDGDTCAITYIKPSSLAVGSDQPEYLSAIGLLDGMLDELVRSAANG